LAVTDAAAEIVNVHVLVLLPPLEQAPDQIALRPFDTDSVIDVPVENDAVPVVPTATLMPVGVDWILSPFLPFAVTVSATVGPGGCDAGATVSEAVFVAPPNMPVIVTAVDAPTAAVFTVNVALVAPAATVTPGGTVAALALLERATPAPDEGAAAVSVTVPRDVLPPVTVVGLMDSVDNAGPGGGAAVPFTVSDAAALSRSNPEIVTAVSDETDDVVIGNVAPEAPAGTRTLAGTVAAPLELKSCTVAPPVGAALCSVTVPLAAVPPLTLAGAIARLTSGGTDAAGGFTVSPRLALLAPYDADSDAAVGAETALAVTNANDADVDPVNTVTDGGSEVKSSG